MLLRGIFIFVALAGSKAVKVNMVGSLSLGQDVVDVLSEYVKQTLVERSARRMMEPTNVQSVVRSARLCRDVPFCSGSYEQNINDYIITLHKAIAKVFEGTLNGEMFELNSKRYLRDVRKILKHADTKVSEDNEVHEWTSVLKKISAAFLERGSEYLHDRIDQNLDKKDAVASVLTQQLVIAIATVEMDYQVMFCTEHSICVKKLECTRALNDVLGQMKNLEDYKVREFVKAFQENLALSPLWMRLDDETKKEFERVLNDMARAENSPAVEILTSVKKSIENRLEAKEPRGNDVLLMHAILSDMDHVFDMKKWPFENFLDKYHDWVRTGDHLQSSMKHVFSDMATRLSEQSSHFRFKLINEVQVFFQLTIGSAVTTT